MPKQLTANGLTDENAEFTDDGLRAIIEGYTMEAGVRTLERTVGTVCRKIAVKYADDRKLKKVKVEMCIRDRRREALPPKEFKR